MRHGSVWGKKNWKILIFFNQKINFFINIGDHQYQTFIDFGYKQFLKIQDIKDQKEDLIFNGQLKIFARVEFEHATLPSSLTWSNYDLLLFKENFKDLYETKNLCDIFIKVVKKPVNNQQSLIPCRNSQLNSCKIKFLDFNTPSFLA